MKFFSWILSCSLTLPTLLAQVQTEVTPQKITLQSNGVLYQFSPQQNYHLTQAKFQNRPLQLGKFGLTYLIRHGNWHRDTNPFPAYAMPQKSHKITRKNGQTTLTISLVGAQMRFIREFTLSDRDPVLRVRLRVEIKGQNKMGWTYLFSTGKLPAKAHFLRITNTLENGRPVNRLCNYPQPFLDKSGKIYAVYELQQWLDQPVAGYYDPEVDAGALFVVQPEKSLRLFKIMRTPAKDFKFISITPIHYSPAPNFGYMEACFEIHPFVGQPEKLNSLMTSVIPKMEKFGLLPQYHDTARLISQNQQLVLWQDYPDNKVYRDRAIPQKKRGMVQLFAARGESEAFQLAVRPQKQDLKQLTWRFSPLISGKNHIAPENLTWSAIEYVKADVPRHGLDVLGDQPDILLGEVATNCVAHQAQPFWFTVKVPDHTVPGLYRGQVELLAQGKKLATIPLQVRVWSFSIAEQNLTGNFSLWNYRYPPERKKEIVATLNKLVAENRGALAFLKWPRAKWDKQGNLISIDFKATDERIRREPQYRKRVYVDSSVELGAGHVPLPMFLHRNPQEILTPVWRNRLLSYAKAINRHWQEKKHPGKLVFYLFDEPYPKYAHLVDETARLLRTVNPKWRCTMANNFDPIYQHINYWTVGHNSCFPSLIDQVRNQGSEIAVYNPPHYGYARPLTLLRSNYYWLWQYRINYIYQWGVNYWKQLGKGWNFTPDYGYNLVDYRDAAWIMPGKTGPLATLRLAVTREGIEDYEYLYRLREAEPKLKKSHPQLWQQCTTLLKRARRISSSAPREEFAIYSQQNPELFAALHREMGELLEKINQLEQ